MSVAHHPHLITTVAQLRAIVGETPPTVTLKIADHVNDTTAAFIEKSPFVLVGTAAPGGGWTSRLAVTRPGSCGSSTRGRC